MKEPNRETIQYYIDLKNEQNNAKRVGWKDKDAQNVRFEKLLGLIQEDNGFTINDLGCGLGDFLKFIYNKGFSNVNYTGYDIFEEMILSAKKANSLENADFKTIKTSEEINLADYTIASGIFNLKHSKTEAEWLSYILKELEIINRKSTKGFAFNMLTKYSDKEFMRDNLYYSDPCFIFDFCKRNFSQNVAILHDYNQYDFTIIVRK